MVAEKGQPPAAKKQLAECAAIQNADCRVSKEARLFGDNADSAHKIQKAARLSKLNV